MMIQEFGKMLPEGTIVFDDEYRIIEEVYMHYPRIDKQGIADLYMKYGMTIIMDMLPRSEAIRELEEQLRRVNGEAHAIDKGITALKEGMNPGELPEEIRKYIY